jgi:hypothetical protein
MNAVEPELIINECVHGDSCPLHAENQPFNAVTLFGRHAGSQGHAKRENPYRMVSFH